MPPTSELWYWDEKTNSLESRISNTTKKSQVVKSLCTKYLQVIPPRDKKQAKKFGIHDDNDHFDRDDPFGLKNQNKKENFGIDSHYAHTAQLNCLFKRAVVAAGKISGLAQKIMTEDRAREWTLDSVKNLAWQEMLGNLKNGKILKFNRDLQSKAYIKPEEDSRTNLGLSAGPSQRTSQIGERVSGMVGQSVPTGQALTAKIEAFRRSQKMSSSGQTGSQSHNQNQKSSVPNSASSRPPVRRHSPPHVSAIRSVKPKNYMEMLKKYISLSEFDDFALALVNYFSVLFELRKFQNDNNEAQNAGKSPKDVKLLEKESLELQKKKMSFEHKLGISYASLLLGDNDIKKYHHMSSGERRLYSFTMTDQILGEIILEFCAMIIYLVFRADKTIDLNDIRVTLGKHFRTNHFNPYFHEKIAEKLENVKKFTVPGSKNSGKSSRRSSVTDSNFPSAKSSSEFTGNEMQQVQGLTMKNVLRLPSLNQSPSNSMLNPDLGDDFNSNSPGQNRTTTSDLINSRKLVPSHERAAAERRIKGNRPSIAAVIHQKSGIISAALNRSSHEVENLSNEYRLQDNMFQLNKVRRESKYFKKHILLSNKRASRKFNKNVRATEPCRRLTIFGGNVDNE